MGGYSAVPSPKGSRPPSSTVRGCRRCPGVSALAVYLTQSQLLPYQGTAELFQELAGIALSPGTLQGAITVAATHLEAPVAAIR